MRATAAADRARARALRVYAAVLRVAYPSAFRARFAEHMADTFLAELDAASMQGRLATLRCWATAAWDAAWFGTMARIDALVDQGVTWPRAFHRPLALLLTTLVCGACLGMAMAMTHVVSLAARPSLGVAYPVRLVAIYRLDPLLSRREVPLTLGARRDVSIPGETDDGPATRHGCARPGGGGGRRTGHQSARRVVDAAIEAGEQLVTDAQARSAAASEALAMLADRLGAIEGRKHLVLYSSGHAISPETQAVDAVAAAVSACTDLDAMAARRDASSALGRLTNRSASDGLRDVIDRANRAQITFYTLDPSGITTSTIMPSTRGTAQTGGQGPLTNFAGLRADAGRDYVEGLAVETGGLTVKSNDMAVVLRRAWEDAGQYYLVGYAPPPAKDQGDLRKITVSVKRPGVSVRYRKGYIAAPTAAAAPPMSEADRAIDEALTAPARFASDDIVVTPTIQQNTLSVEVLIRPTAIAFSEVSGRYEADFVVHAVLRDTAQPATTIDIPGKVITLQLTRDEYAKVTAAATLRIVLTTEAPRGEVRLTGVVRDTGGWIGASEVHCRRPLAGGEE